MNSDEEKQILEDYKIWKKNSPFLYELVLSQVLSWPSLTVSWFPDCENVNGDVRHSLLLGTHSKEEQNYLMIATLDLPDSGCQPDTNEFHGFGSSSGRFNITHRIPHSTEVNRARYMPQRPSVIASRGLESDIFVFDYKNNSKSFLRLVGHKTDGYGLSWNKNEEGLLASSADEDVVCVWDINKAEDQTAAPAASVNISQENNELTAEDVCWHSYEKKTLLAGLSDGCFVAVDLRSNKITKRVKAHGGVVYSVDYSPFSEHIFATGSADETIAIWDRRKLVSDSPVYRLKSYCGEVNQLSWSPLKDSLIAASGSDRKVNIWDLRNYNETVLAESLKDDDVCSELIFIHGGHTSAVNDFSWSHREPYMISSVAADNVMQVWQIIYDDGDDVFLDVSEKRHNVNVNFENAPSKLTKI